jgi:hypothetical protein
MTTTQAGLEFSQKPEMELIEEVCDKQSPVDEELVEGTEEERKLLGRLISTLCQLSGSFTSSLIW